MAMGSNRYLTDIDMPVARNLQSMAPRQPQQNSADNIRRILRMREMQGRPIERMLQPQEVKPLGARNNLQNNLQNMPNQFKQAFIPDEVKEEAMEAMPPSRRKLMLDNSRWLMPGPNQPQQVAPAPLPPAPQLERSVLRPR